MNTPFQRYSTRFAFILLMFSLNGCSSIVKDVLKEPEISVGELKLVKAGLINQTFLLTLLVTNPNQVTLPIKSFTYNIQLAGDEFASGSTSQAFSIPSKGTESIDLTVKLNLLRSSSHLVNIIKSGSKDINYQINGSIAIDLPFMAPVPVSKVGSLKLSR